MPFQGDRRAVPYPDRPSRARGEPFWFRRPTYYLIAVAVTSLSFMIVWGFLHDSGSESPVGTAAISAVIFLSGVVALRELVFGRARDNSLPDKRDPVARDLADEMYPVKDVTAKLSVEQSNALLAEIKKRSDAANVLSKFSAGHKEVFELCAEYLTLIEGELKRMNPGSPRLKPFLKGRARASDAHRFHTLRWAEIEATESTLRAQTDPDPEVQRESAAYALEIVERALAAYPGDQSLIGSRAVLAELVVSINVKALVEEGARAALDGRYGESRTAYREALDRLDDGNIQSEERKRAVAHINNELEKIKTTADDSPHIK